MSNKSKLLLILIGLFSGILWQLYKPINLNIANQEAKTGTTEASHIKLTYQVQSNIEVFQYSNKKTLRSRDDNFTLNQTILNSKDSKALSIFTVNIPDFSKDTKSSRIYVQSDKNGRIIDFVSSPDSSLSIDPWLKNYLETLISRLQFALPLSKSNPPNNWRCIEKDQYGNYLAFYRQTYNPDKNYLYFDKLIKGYNERANLDQPSLLPENKITLINPTPMNLKINKKNLTIESVFGHTAHEIKQDDIDYLISHRFNFKLLAIEASKDHLNYDEIHAIFKQVDRGKKPQKTNDSVKKDFLKIDKLISSESSNELNQLFSEAVDYYNLNPDQLDLVQKNILSLDEDDTLFMKKASYLFGILAENKSSKSEPILLDLLHNKNNVILHQALAALSDIENPSEQSVYGLIDFNDNLVSNDEMHHQAHLALGTISSKLRRASQKGHQEATDYLFELSHNLSSDEKISILDALGNDGSNQHLSFIKSFLGDKDSIIRGRAIYQLRKLSDPAVLDIMFDAIKSENDPFVWTEGLKALEYYPASERLITTLYNLIELAPTPELQYNYAKAMIKQGGCCISQVEKNLSRLQMSSELNHLRKDLVIWINHLSERID